MFIRIAEYNDLKDIVKIYNQAVAIGQRTADIEPVSTQSKITWFNEHVKDKYPIYVAIMDGKIAGWLSISPYRPGRKAVRFTAEVSYYIDNRYKRLGVCSKLLSNAINECPSLGIKTLFGILLETNKASIALLEKFNFQRWGYMPAIADFDGVEVGHLYYGLRITK